MEIVQSWLEAISALLYVYIRTIGEAIFTALTLNPERFKIMLDDPQLIYASTVVLAVAGISQILGQVVVLHINRVPLAARVRVVLLGILMLIGDFVFWLAAIGLIAGVVFGSWQQPASIIRVLSIAYAPMMLSFVVLVPYAGPALLQGLRFWTVLAVTVAITVTFNLPPVAAATCAIAGWLGHYLVVHTISRLTRTHLRVVEPADGTSTQIIRLAREEGRRWLDGQ